MDCVALSKASSHFITDGAFTRFADWRFIHKARLNLHQLNGYQHDPSKDKSCRSCGYRNKTLPHVLNHYMGPKTHAYQLQHNALLARVKKAAERKFSITSENRNVPGTTLRPDLILQNESQILIVDVTVPFENNKSAFEQARQLKLTKYHPLIEKLKTAGKTVVIEPFVVGSLGSWDPANDRLMNKLCSRSYLGLFRKLCVSDTIRWSRDIYVHHMTGRRQYDPNNFPETEVAFSLVEPEEDPDC